MPHENRTFFQAPHPPLSARDHQRTLNPNISPWHFLGKPSLAKTKLVSDSYAIKHG